MRRRIVITGLGPMTGFGVGIAPLWAAMVEGRSAIRRIGQFDPDGFEGRIAAEIRPEDFDVRKVVPRNHRKATKVMCRDTQLAVGGAAAAGMVERMIEVKTSCKRSFMSTSFNIVAKM